MIEKIRHISNPLTIIAIFAALAEVAGTVVLALVSPENQKIFMWFVMLFPTALVAAFFLTLNFNPRVLYAPSDFQDEANFLQIVAGRNRLSMEFADVMAQLEESKAKIVDDALNELGERGESERQRLVDAVERQIQAIRNILDSTRESTEELVDDFLPRYLTRSDLQARIIAYLVRERQHGAHMIGDIANAVGMSRAATEKALERLQKNGLIIATMDPGGVVDYRLSERFAQAPNKAIDGDEK